MDLTMNKFPMALMVHDRDANAAIHVLYTLKVWVKGILWPTLEKVGSTDPLTPCFRGLCPSSTFQRLQLSLALGLVCHYSRVERSTLAIIWHLGTFLFKPVTVTFFSRHLSFWCECWTDCSCTYTYLLTWPMSANLSLLAADDDFDHPTSPRVMVWGSKHLYKSGRSLIHCCWTASVEQPTSPSTWLWTYSPGVSPVTEDAPVLLRTSALVLTVAFTFRVQKGWRHYTRSRQVKWPGWKIHRPGSALPIVLLR